jgi:hypothetical protein
LEPVHTGSEIGAPFLALLPGSNVRGLLPGRDQVVRAFVRVGISSKNRRLVKALLFCHWRSNREKNQAGLARPA